MHGSLDKPQTASGGHGGVGMTSCRNLEALKETEPFPTGIHRLNYLISELDGVYHAIALKFKLSDSAFQILYALCNGGGSCPLHEICNLYGTSKQTINSSLRKLEESNIVYLQNSGGRTKTVCLTEYGQQRIQDSVLRLIREEDNILKSWTEEEQELYLSLTQRYLASLREKIPVL